MQYKRIISFGDSFTWGSDLADQRGKQHSKLTWPALLAKHYNIKYQCYARPGESNQAILRMILRASFEPTDLVIVNWTWIDRYEYYNNIESEWRPLRPSGTESDPLCKTYYKYIQNDLSSKFESLRDIQVFLSTVGVNYLTTALDPLLLDTKYHCPDYIQKLINQIKPHINWFDGKSFYEWTKNQGYSMSDNWHPLEEAHQAAFEYILENKWLNAS